MSENTSAARREHPKARELVALIGGYTANEREEIRAGRGNGYAEAAIRIASRYLEEASELRQLS